MLRGVYVTPIRNDEDLAQSHAEIGRLLNARANGMDDEGRLEVLAVLVRAYEQEHHLGVE